MIKTRENELRNSENWHIIKNTANQLKIILNEFNLRVDTVLKDETIEKMPRNTENKCQITHIVDAEKRICYCIDPNR